MKNSANKPILKNKHIKVKAHLIKEIDPAMSNSTTETACVWMNGFVFGAVLGLSVASLITILASYV